MGWDGSSTAVDLRQQCHGVLGGDGLAKLQATDHPLHHRPHRIHHLPRRPAPQPPHRPRPPPRARTSYRTVNCSPEGHSRALALTGVHGVTDGEVTAAALKLLSRLRTGQGWGLQTRQTRKSGRRKAGRRGPAARPGGPACRRCPESCAAPTASAAAGPLRRACTPGRVAVNPRSSSRHATTSHDGRIRQPSS